MNNGEIYFGNDSESFFGDLAHRLGGPQMGRFKNIYKSFRYFLSKLRILIRGQQLLFTTQYLASTEMVLIVTF